MAKLVCMMLISDIDPHMKGTVLAVTYAQVKYIPSFQSKIDSLAEFSSTMWINFIATSKALFSSKKCWYLSYFSTNTYVVGTH